MIDRERMSGEIRLFVEEKQYLNQDSKYNIKDAKIHGSNCASKIGEVSAGELITFETDQL